MADVPFIPSRKRLLSATTLSAATQMQPTGKALPSLITGEFPDSSGQVAAARNIKPLPTLIQQAASPRDMEIARMCVKLPEKLNAKRTDAIETARELATSFGPERKRRAESPPSDMPCQNLHYHLIHFLAKRLEFPDANVLRDLTQGIPIVGTAPPTAGLTPRVTPAETKYEIWKAGSPVRNKAAIERIRKTHGTALANACCEKSQAEFEAGWISPPIPLGDVTSDSISLTPRYALPEQHGNQVAKIRLIGDFKLSGINGLLITKDANIPGALDAFLSYATYLKLIEPGCNVQAVSVDYKHAYKNIAVDRDHTEFAHILIAPPTGPLMVSQVHSLPLGPRRSPSNWPRITSFVKFVLDKIFRVSTSVYVDDCFVVEPCQTIASALSPINAINAAIQLALGHSKANTPNEKIELLGSEIELGDERITACLPGRRRNALAHCVRHILQRNRLTPANAAKLRGRSGRPQTFMCAIFDRARLGPLTDRQYSTNTCHTLCESLKEVLPRWTTVLNEHIPSVAKYNPRDPLLI